MICSPRKSRRSLLKPYSIASKPNSSYTHYLGRTTMKLDRAQTMLTQGANDAISCLGDAIQYTDVHIENSSVVGGEWWRFKFHDGGNMMNIVRVLMLCLTFQDTCSATAKCVCRPLFNTLPRYWGMSPVHRHGFPSSCLATPEQLKLYKGRFIPEDKNL